jgi:hypothetical protein
MTPKKPDTLKPDESRAWDMALEAFDWERHGEEILSFARENSAIHALVTLSSPARYASQTFPHTLSVACPASMGKDGVIDAQTIEFELERPDLDADRLAKRYVVRMLLLQCAVALNEVGTLASHSKIDFRGHLADPQYWSELERRRLSAVLDETPRQIEPAASPAPAPRRSSVRL